jgi:microsomal dipeptidase-like Zn-dependent dipeptidase
MDELKMFVDLSHATPRLFKDTLSLSNRPILVTHTGVHAICTTKSTRNLSNKQIKQLAQSGGLIGVGFWPAATCNKGSVKPRTYTSRFH